MYYDDPNRRMNVLTGLLLGVIAGFVIGVVVRPSRIRRRRPSVRRLAESIRNEISFGGRMKSGTEETEQRSWRRPGVRRFGGHPEYRARFAANVQVPA